MQHSRTVLGTLLLGLALAGCSSTTGPAGPPGPSGPPGSAAPPAGSEPASAATRELRFDVRTTTSLFFRKRLDVDAGRSLVTYSASLEGFADDSSPNRPLKGECYVFQATTKQLPDADFGSRTFYTADESTHALGDGEMSLSGSGLVDTLGAAGGRFVYLECELNNGEARKVSWGTNPAEPIQVTITPVAG